MNDDVIEAKLFRSLRELCGHTYDGSETTVKIHQDDATRTFHIDVGNRSYWGNSLGSAITRAFEAEQKRTDQEPPHMERPDD